MDDLISKKAVIEAIEKCHKMCCREDACGDEWIHYETVLNEVECIPPAEPKRGKWIEDKGQQTLMQNFIERGEVWRVCSVCGAGHMIGHKYAIDKAYHDRHHNYCPNCGAKMEVTT